MATLHESTGHIDITTGTMQDAQGRTQVAVYLDNAVIFISTHDDGVWTTQRLSQSPLGPQSIDELCAALTQAIIDTGLVACDLHEESPAYMQPTESDIALSVLLDAADSEAQAYADHAAAVRKQAPAIYSCWACGGKEPLCIMCARKAQTGSLFDLDDIPF